VESSRFDYDLPEDRIAQQPAEPRDSSRLLVDRGGGHPAEHRRTVDLPELVGPGDLLVVNDTRVLPARLGLCKATGGHVEVLLLEPRRGAAERPGEWEALVRPGRRVPPGTELSPDGGGPTLVTVGERLAQGRRVVSFADPTTVPDLLERHGEVPLPPYITATDIDPDRYQTVYADRAASVAAPTAGLHLTDDVLARCRERGAELARIELTVGLDTFRPITVEDIDDHPMHSERYRIEADTLARCRAAGRVIAVGTTVVRALEAAALTDQASGRTDLFIRPGFEFRVVDALMTNFHLPRSSLLVLIEAFVGARWRDLYAEAAGAGYRFLSFGDAMLLSRAASRRGEDG
jgi:S-adenosylmethionine:tRNA ribosyltransferase-isomerase